MAHRKTQAEATEVKAQFESNHPDAIIVIKNHPRGGFLIVEARICEKCGCKFTTAAVGEDEVGGDYCNNCKGKVYEQYRQERKVKSAARNAEQEAISELMERLNN